MRFWSGAVLAALASTVSCRPDDEPKKVAPPRVQTQAGTVDDVNPGDAGTPVTAPPRRIPSH